MPFFLLSFFAIYGALHSYAFFRIRRGLPGGPLVFAAIALWMIAMVAAPVLVRLAEQAGHYGAARWLAVVGYSWMGMVFLFVSVALVVDCVRLLLWLAVRCRLPADLRLAFWLPGLTALLLFGYGLHEARAIRTVHLTIPSAKLPPASERLRIVQISDVHLGLLVGAPQLERILAAVRAAGPDLFVSTGDLVDGHMADPARLAALLAGVRAPLGKYAVTGNHEFYSGVDRAAAFTEEAGFTLLRNEVRRVNGVLSIAGVDDKAAGTVAGTDPLPAERLLRRVDPSTFVLFLRHRPLVEGEAAGLFDLQLSGHIHNGQIFPFTLLTRLVYPTRPGILHRLAAGGWLYVSQGSGTWGPPIRVLAPPEVTVIDVVPAAAR